MLPDCKRLDPNRLATLRVTARLLGLTPKNCAKPAVKPAFTLSSATNAAGSDTVMPMLPSIVVWVTTVAKVVVEVSVVEEVIVDVKVVEVSVIDVVEV